MSKQQGLISGLSREVTIAVLPRLNMEELIFELNRRIQNLDKKTSIKEKLVSILRDVMLEEYRQLERKSEVGSSDETNIPEQEQESVTMQDNVSNVNAEAMSTKASRPDTPLQSSGLGIASAINKKNDESCSEVLMQTKEHDVNRNRKHLTATEQKQLCNITSPGSAKLPLPDTSMTQINTSKDSHIKDEDVAMTTRDETARVCHDELNIDTPTFNIRVLGTIKPVSHSCTVKPFGGDKTCEETPSASREPTPDIRKWEYAVSEVNKIGQISQPSNLDHADNRNTAVSINMGHKQNNVKSDQPGDFPACENISSIVLDNAIPKDFKPYMCSVCGLRTMYRSNLSRHMQKHTGGKLFMCGECGYRAYHKFRLVEHMRTHTGEKPFKCDQCDFKTAHKSDLVIHLKKHAGQEPYSCKICDYKTYRKPDVKKHMKCHAGVRPQKHKKCGTSQARSNST
ncbi:zinc finger protein 37-like [Branchiostoma lanceolatum]|uniref:zinc finger protein 37-like n=1 Tax=Branchiostoma lanceolatum TaxID=7740 RepID=UPI00345520B0